MADEGTKVIFECSSPSIHSEFTNSPNDISKITAKLEKGSRACFKGVMHGVLKELQNK